MLKYDIKYQENYSRGELLLRSFFGFIYIGIPHMFCLFFLLIWGSILTFLSFWIILFTGRYPQSFFEYQVSLARWSARVNASLLNLVDGYPPFGLSSETDMVTFEVAYPENLSRGLLIVKALFGFIYVLVPHMFILIFRTLWGSILQFLAWWVVLFTGRYPQSWHEFNVGTLRWGARVNLYMTYMSDEYPPFSGK